MKSCLSFSGSSLHGGPGDRGGSIPHPFGGLASALSAAGVSGTSSGPVLANHGGDTNIPHLGTAAYFPWFPINAGAVPEAVLDAVVLDVAEGGTALAMVIGEMLLIFLASLCLPSQLNP